MTHIRKPRTLSFDVQTAIEYGVDEAIMILNLLFWIEKNLFNKKHQHDGRTWTYNTQEAFTHLFPFWSRRQIQRILESLERQNVIIKGNYNLTAYDRTHWYAFKDESKWLNIPEDIPQTLDNPDDTKPFNALNQSEKSIEPNTKIESTISFNGKHQDVQPIPDNYQITTKNNNNNSETISSNHHAIHAHELLLSLNFEEITPTPSKALLSEPKERQKEEVVLLPLSGLNERQTKEASKKLAQLSPDQREIAIMTFNQTAELGRIRKPMALVNQLVNLGLNNELEPPLNAFNQNPTPTPTQELKTHSEANNEASNEDYRRETILEVLKLKVAKYKNKMLAEFQRNRAVFIQGLGVFYKDDLAAAGLFD